MKMTAYDLGKRPTQYLAGEQSVEERARRQDLARQAAKALGKQSTLADRLGVHRVYVSRWIKGERPVPDDCVPALIEVIEVNV